MAITLEGLRAKIYTSIHGRRLGIDKDGFLLGAKPVRRAVAAATTATSGTELTNHGFHTVTSTTDGGWVLADPVAGCKVDIISISASTNALTFGNATVHTTNGIASSSAKFNAIGEAISLVGISTSKWACVSNVNAVVFSS